MKNVFVSIFLLALVNSGLAQRNRKNVPTVTENKEAPFTICLTYPMTTHLVFNNPIEYYDIGAAVEEVEIGITKENNKVLKIILKSNKTPSFTKTNLTIRTAGKYYSYICAYKKDCGGIPFIYMKDTFSIKYNKENTKVQDNNETDSVSEVPQKKVYKYDSTSAMLLKKHKFFERYESTNTVGKIQMSLSKCFVKNDKLYFIVKIMNESSIGYDINSFNFSISTLKKSKGKATQINQVNPIYVYNNSMYVKGFNNEIIKVFILDKFTFNEKNKELFIESWEKNGDRNLKCRVSQSDVLNAVPF